MSPEELTALADMTADERCDYLVETLNTLATLWTLSSDDGMVLMTAEGDECLPIWPHEELAQAWATGDWSDCAPVSIDLKAWMERWLPGMQADGYVVAIFPSLDEDGVVMSPDDFKALIESQQGD